MIVSIRRNEPPQHDDDFMPNCVQSQGLVATAGADTNITTDSRDTLSNNTEPFAESFYSVQEARQKITLVAVLNDVYLRLRLTGCCSTTKWNWTFFASVGCSDHINDDKDEHYAVPDVAARSDSPCKPRRIVWSR